MGSCFSLSLPTQTPRRSILEKARSSQLIGIIYISRSVNGYFDHPQQMDALIRYAAANNSQLGVSGYLLVVPPFFLQRLEGPEAIISGLVNGIQGDHRHKDFMVVKRGAIAQREFSQWSMRLINAHNSSDSFDAVAIILQLVCRILTVASRTLHPKFFDDLLAGNEFDLRDETHEMIVVTISLGRSVVNAEPGQAMVADVSFLGAFVPKLYAHLCSINSKDKGSVVLFGGMVIQVAIPWIKGSHNLVNKVVEACTELLLGQWDLPARRLRFIVDCGKVRVSHLCVEDTLRKGRYIYGGVLAKGAQLGKDVLDTPHLVLLSGRLCDYMQPEFVTTNVVIAGHKMAVVEFPHKIPPRHQSTVGSTANAVAHTGEKAVAILTNHANHANKEAKDQKEDLDHHSASFEELADLEWMYNLDKLSNAYQKSKKKRNPAPPRVHHRASTTLGFGERSSNENLLLNVVYTSEVSEDFDPSPADIQAIGQASAMNNSQRDITGYLLYSKPYFVQYLEGPPAQVKALFTKLRRDWRHRNVTLLVSRTIRDGRRSYTAGMKTTDLSESQNNAPLREVLPLLTELSNNLNAWLPRMHYDLLLASTQLVVGANAQCGLVAFAAIHPGGSKHKGSKAPSVNSLAPFLDRGGEIAGFLGNHLIGYAFDSSVEMLVDQVAELCADFRVSVGICRGIMLAVNCSSENDQPDVQLFGDLFQRAQERADQAAKLGVQILADESCMAAVRSVIWVQNGDVMVGSVSVDSSTGHEPMEHVEKLRVCPSPKRALLP